MSTSKGKERRARALQDAHFTLLPMKNVPLITPLMYLLALLVTMPFYMAWKRPDYVIVDDVTAIIGFILKFFMRPLKLKVVMDVRSTPIRVKDTFMEKVDAGKFRLSINLARKQLDGITIVTDLMKKEICDDFNISPGFVGVWTSGVSLELFNPRAVEGEEIKRNLGLDRKFVVFYHGSLRTEGLVETIKAIKRLKPKYPDIVFFILGNVSRLSEGVCFLKNLAREHGIQNDVLVHGKVGLVEVSEYIAMGDIGIVPLSNSPNWRYQSPLKLVEYLAMEKTVIVTDIPANRMIVGKSKCGIYIRSASPEQIAGAISYAYDNREKLKEWGSLGRKIIEERYTYDKLAEQFEDYLAGIVA
jgi:glycosyltransferase involved in cell wall biosynthesis